MFGRKSTEIENKMKELDTNIITNLVSGFDRQQTTLKQLVSILGLNINWYDGRVRGIYYTYNELSNMSHRIMKLEKEVAELKDKSLHTCKTCGQKLKPVVSFK